MATNHPRLQHLTYAAIAAALFLVAAGAEAATASEFYLNLLRRGASNVDAGRYEQAVEPLRVAAFGLVESIPEYETAQVNLAVACDKLGNQDEVRAAAMRVIAAERIEQRYPSLTLSPAVRAAFEAVAQRVLTPAEFSMLHRATATTASSGRPAATSANVTPAEPRPTNDPPAVKSATPATSEEPKAPPTTMTSTVTTAPTRNAVPSTPSQRTPVTTTPAAASARPTTPPANVPSKVAPPASTASSPSQAPKLSAAEVDARLQAGEKALGAGQLADARRSYHEILDRGAASHELLLRVGEGLYRARDFSGALSALNRAGALKPGEEPYRYYIAVALYETGDFAAAKRELKNALPYIEMTPDVSDYRSRIESRPEN